MTSSRTSAARAVWTLDGAAQTVARPHVGRQELAAVGQHDRAQDRPLSQRQPLPDRLEHHFLLGQQAAQRRVQIVERGAPAPGRAHLVPGFVRQALDVVGEVAGQVDDGRAQAVFRA